MRYLRDFLTGFLAAVMIIGGAASLVLYIVG